MVVLKIKVLSLWIVYWVGIFMEETYSIRKGWTFSFMKRALLVQSVSYKKDHYSPHIFINAVWFQTTTKIMNVKSVPHVVYKDGLCWQLLMCLNIASSSPRQCHWKHKSALEKTRTLSVINLIHFPQGDFWIIPNIENNHNPLVIHQSVAYPLLFK